MLLGDQVTILLDRDYGPYLTRPLLPAGEYAAEVASYDYGTGTFDFVITVGTCVYTVLGEDCTVIEERS